MNGWLLRRIGSWTEKLAIGLILAVIGIKLAPVDAKDLVKNVYNTVYNTYITNNTPAKTAAPTPPIPQSAAPETVNPVPVQAAIQPQSETSPQVVYYYGAWPRPPHIYIAPAPRVIFYSQQVATFTPAGHGLRPFVYLNPAPYYRRSTSYSSSPRHSGH